MTNNIELDEILDSVLIGMFMRDAGGNFVPLDDKYNVLRNEAKQAISEYIESREQKLMKRVLDHYASRHEQHAAEMDELASLVRNKNNGHQQNRSPKP